MTNLSHIITFTWFSQVVQRVVFLHEDLVKLPTFPRKALEAELDLYEKGEVGKVSSNLSGR